MARANEFLFFFDPGNSTAKVCANCRQDDQFAFGIFADVNGLFCDRLAPAVALLDGDQLLYRRINVLKFVTGVFLAMYYVPSADHAHTTVAYITKEVTGGSFLRSIHAYGSSA